MLSNLSKRWRHAVQMMRQAAGTVYDAMRMTWTELHNRVTLMRESRTLEWNRAAAKRTEEHVNRILLERQRQQFVSGRRAAASSLTTEESMLLRHIRNSVRMANRNNVTRTAAYGRIYKSYPELHWAFLAHMVSRNGGWNMTDLQGEWLPRIMSANHRLWAYRLLERSNALIFHDAYPQLLLYAASRREGKSLFHLLPTLDISAFMTPFWESFWVQPNSSLLTTALIVNEQNVIEGRVVQHPDYREHVINKWDFRLHGWMQMNQVIFPLGVPSLKEHEAVPLVGLTLEDFSDVNERIFFGRKLYALLFHTPEIYGGALRYMRAVPHTGSRSDYWPHIFTKKAAVPEHVRLPSAHRAYSPSLTDVWQDEPYTPIEPGDWFIDDRMLKHMQPTRPPLHIDMTLPHDRLWKETASLAGFIQPS
ncbi:DUF2515 domain-containing protein [Paenibacillus profundus]|uniref:DUF2515 domain-containing protein n=1 Tax=Paenibacillus profundus TaxID=1173085 RepID=A0ABS8YIW0_9BACL|nr:MULTISPECIES: DUF2515 family protein [Paenibacillus]MCE5171512.1 DUF2515 domain-containing protein [Paenibacillus profundus]